MKKYEFKNDSNDRELATKEYFDRLPYPVTKHFTEGRFDFYDCSYYVHDPAKKNTYKDKEILLEIKSRNCLSTKYPTTYISKYKYDALVAVGIFQPTRLLVMFQDCMYFFDNII